MARGSNTTATEANPRTRTASGRLSAALKRIKELDAGQLPSREDFQALCEFADPLSGISAKVEKVETIRQQEMMLKGRLYHQGQPIGEFERWCHRDGFDLEYLAVKPSWLKIDPDFQGRGFGARFHSTFEERCRAAGADRIEILATDVGSYSWAGNGYQLHTFYPYPRLRDHYFSDDISTTQAYAIDCAEDITGLVNKKEDRLAQLLAKGRISTELVAQLEQRLFRREDKTDDWEQTCHKAATSIHTPADLSRFGRDQAWTDQDGRETWLGKELLIGSEWRGVKYLQDPPIDIPEN